MFKRISRKRARSNPSSATPLELSQTDSDQTDSDSDSLSDQEADHSELSPLQSSSSSSLTTTQALLNPIFASPLDENTQSCMICSGVLLKNAHMVTEHVQSNSHKRRVKRLKKYVESHDDASKQAVEEVLSNMDQETLNQPSSENSQKSGRAIRRETFIAKQREAAANRKNARQKPDDQKPDDQKPGQKLTLKKPPVQGRLELGSSGQAPTSLKVAPPTEPVQTRLQFGSAPEVHTSVKRKRR